MRYIGAIMMAVLASSASGAAAPDSMSATDYRADAGEIAALIAANYAYLDDLPGGAVPTSPMLTAERDAVHDRDSLLRYAEDMVTALADHHAMTGSSFKDDWAIVPSYADLWVVKRGDAYIIDAVKPDTPAARAGIVAGERLVAVDGVVIDRAVAAFWDRLGLAPVGERAPFAARVLAAGRRDRGRTLATRDGKARVVTLASLYVGQVDRPPLRVMPGKNGAVTIVFNNALGDDATITAFDAAMAKIAPRAAVTLDLTDTPSGGTTSIARAVMGWFVTRPMAYQVHNLPAEARETGIARQWIEQVLPRAGKYHPGPVSVRVGRWTGSLGEGLAIGFAALGKPVCGTAMARLKGAVYDFDLTHSRLRLKFPAERLYTITGQPREKVVLRRCVG
ncbi:PDZ domain-containing protein [Sphingomonas sp. RT2P30]|uniref:S41 family peptidase n=1 Tax=Parasphingomonas halimpatiens TaxID=3096162 RepID=UPI002FCA5615